MYSYISKDNISKVLGLLVNVGIAFASWWGGLEWASQVAQTVKNLPAMQEWKTIRIQDGGSGRKVEQRSGVLFRKLVEESAILQYLLCWGKAMG